VTTVIELANGLLDAIAAEDPLNEFLDGHPGFEDELGDPDEAAQQALRHRALGIAAQARKLETDDWVTRAVIVQQAESLADRLDARLIEHTMHDFEICPIVKLLTVLPEPRPRTSDQEGQYLRRLAAIPEFLAKSAVRHRAGLAAGRLPIADRARSAVAHLDRYLARPADDPLRKVPVRDVAERDRLIDDVVRPAFVTYRQVLRELVPHGRPMERPGLCWLPDGEATYAALARNHTTTDRTPEELHRTGLGLIERLVVEYLEIGANVFGVSTPAEVHHRLRTDPAMRYHNAEEVLEISRAAIERAEEAASDWFGLIPAQQCEVRPTPADQAPHSSVAYYVPGTADGSRPGIYYANTYKAEERDRCIAETNAFHEAVPGHHFQITLAQQLTHLPRLRRTARVNAYIEGWALYCERFADEIGLYSDDLARLGMLALESIRTARLVVDTGVHAFGWSRQRVVDYLREFTVMNEVEIQQETDRYIEWPGQALSYMVGRLEIQRMRARAELTLGAAFDLRAFHDLLLGGGPLPLAVLDDVVTQWTTRDAGPMPAL
jgi:uncharacterized protein (DUF885 family)